MILILSPKWPQHKQDCVLLWTIINTEQAEPRAGCRTTASGHRQIKSPLLLMQRSETLRLNGLNMAVLSEVVFSFHGCFSQQLSEAVPPLDVDIGSLYAATLRLFVVLLNVCESVLLFSVVMLHVSHFASHLVFMALCDLLKYLWVWHVFVVTPSCFVVLWHLLSCL